MIANHFSMSAYQQQLAVSYPCFVREIPWLTYLRSYFHADRYPDLLDPQAVASAPVNNYSWPVPNRVVVKQNSWPPIWRVITGNKK